ncbi:MAG: class I SAM-dependent methyltransferase [Planctomycetota bacterium]
MANNAMNRERGIAGTNSYAKDLGFDLVALLAEKLEHQDRVSWLDLCCGTGKALIEAGQEFEKRGLGDRVRVRGVDLVGYFLSVPAGITSLSLEVSPLREFEPAEIFDLVTCVHGLHYVGNKLGLVARASQWLQPDGLFLANLDLASVKLVEGSAGRRVPRALREAGMVYDARKRLLSCRGRREVDLPFGLVGADDQAGPNYTGQPAVDSYYRAL